MEDHRNSLKSEKASLELYKQRKS